MITWDEPQPKVQFKLMWANSRGGTGDVTEEHLRKVGYVPAAELEDLQKRVEKAEAEIARIRTGLRCQDWVRVGWADAILFLEKEAGHGFELHALEDEARRRFMLGPDDPIRPENDEYSATLHPKLAAAAEADRKLRVCLKAVTSDWDDAARALAREARAQPASSPLAHGKTNRAEAFEIAAAAVRRALDDFPPVSGCIECGNDFAEGYCPHKKADV